MLLCFVMRAGESQRDLDAQQAAWHGSVCAIATWQARRVLTEARDAFRSLLRKLDISGNKKKEPCPKEASCCLSTSFLPQFLSCARFSTGFVRFRQSRVAVFSPIRDPATTFQWGLHEQDKGILSREMVTNVMPLRILASHVPCCAAVVNQQREKLLSKFMQEFTPEAKA